MSKYYNERLAAFPKQNLEVYEVLQDVQEPVDGVMKTFQEVAGYIVVKDNLHEEIPDKWFTENFPDNPTASNSFDITTIGDASYEESMPWADHVENDPYINRDDLFFGHVKHVRKKVESELPPFKAGPEWINYYGRLIDLLIKVAGYPTFDWDYETQNRMFQS